MSPILISVITSISILGLTTYINIKTKFAPDEKTAMNNVKILIYCIALILCCSLAVYSLIKEFILDAPLNRTSLLVILINSFSLFYIFIILHLHRMLSLIEKLIKHAQHL